MNIMLLEFVLSQSHVMNVFQDNVHLLSMLSSILEKPTGHSFSTYGNIFRKINISFPLIRICAYQGKKY